MRRTCRNDFSRQRRPFLLSFVILTATWQGGTIPWSPHSKSNTIVQLTLQQNDLHQGEYEMLRRRWIKRQERMAWGNFPVNATKYSSNLTLLASHSNSLCEQFGYEQVCSTVGHRQKPLVKLVLSSESWAAAEIDLGRRDCAVSACDVSSKDRHTNSTDIFVASYPTDKAVPKKVRLGQVNAFIQLEPGEVEVNDTGTVDWIASHIQGNISASSYIRTSYINADGAAFRLRGKRYHLRRKQLPIFISNCHARSDRLSVVQKLGRYVEIEQFGQCKISGATHKEMNTAYPTCSNMPRRSAMWDAQKECIYFNSMFGLVLESAYEENYLTEKLFQVLKNGAVPIIAGDPSLYRKHLPSPNAAIFLAEFTSYRSASLYIKKVMKSRRLWHAHNAWKGLETFPIGFEKLLQHSFATLMCDICDKYGNEILPATEPDAVPLSPCTKHFLAKHNIGAPERLPELDPKLGFDAIFVTHYSRLSERKQTMIDRIWQQFRSEATFVTSFDRDVFTEDMRKCFNDRATQHDYISRNTTAGEDSLSLKHFAIYYYMVEHSLQNVLVLEDDATFVHTDWTDSDSLWQHMLRNLPTDYDMLILSGCCGLHKMGIKITEHIYLSQASRVSSMYLISQKGARNMLRTLPLVGPIDFQMNFAVGYQTLAIQTGRQPQTLGMKIFHSEPYLSEQILPEGSSPRSVLLE